MHAYHIRRGKICIWARAYLTPYPTFKLEVFLLPLDGMLIAMMAKPMKTVEFTDFSNEHFITDPKWNSEFCFP